MECLRDHKGWPESICNHTPPEEKDVSAQWQTNASMIYDFSEAELHLCCGPPCEGEYFVFSL